MTDRSSLAQIRMVWPTLDARVTVDLQWEKAPQLCGLLAEQLPFASTQEHALITGGMLFATTRVSTLVRENVTAFTQMAVGACYFACGSQNVGLVYGPVTEPEAHSVWGVVPASDHAVLERVGHAIWRNTLAPFGDPAINPAAKQIIPVEFRPV